MKAKSKQLVEEKKCGVCEKVKKITEFYFYHSVVNGKKYEYHHTWCKDCQNKYSRKYQKTKEGIKKANRSCLAFHKRNYGKNKKFTKGLIARGCVQKAIKSGKLKRGSCEVCGKENAEAHHEDYNKPLEVMWLCKKHHTILEKNKRTKLKESK